MDIDTWIRLDDLADERHVSVGTLRQLCQRARITTPLHERLSPSAWKRLDRYLYKHYKVAAGEPLPRM